jgi:uncharacterized protein YfiM (DUF2279 family)
MSPAAVLLSSSLVSHARWLSGSGFRSLLGIFVISLLITVNSSAQDSLVVTGKSDAADQLELSGSILNSQTGGVIFCPPLDMKKIFGKEKLMPNDTNRLTPQLRKSRIRLVAAGNIIAYGGTMVGLYAAWYKNYDQTGFHSFNDFPEWKQMDKVGHLYSAYIESRASMELWRWAGLERKKRIWIGGMSGAAYQTIIEVLDGFSEGWGWSWGDFGANILGSGALVAQELAWDEQRIKLKFSFHRKTYNDPELNRRSNVLFGKGTAERLLKDYNGQTYWASANIRSFFPQSKWPAWLSISVGYGAEGMFGGRENIAKDETGTITFNRPDIKRYRQWYLAPDIDLTRIRTNKKLGRFILTVLSAFKFPTPALEFSNGKLRLKALVF